jgi:hypothetical protein
MVTGGRGCHNADMAETPAQEPELNVVRLCPEHGYEYGDGSQWITYPEVPDDGEQPRAVVRG